MLSELRENSFIKLFGEIYEVTHESEYSLMLRQYGKTGLLSVVRQNIPFLPCPSAEVYQLHNPHTKQSTWFVVDHSKRIATPVIYYHFLGYCSFAN